MNRQPLFLAFRSGPTAGLGAYLNSKFLAAMFAPGSCLQVCFLLVLMCTSAHAKTTTWLRSAPGNWSNPGNWTNGVPVDNDTVHFSNANNGDSTLDIAGLTLASLDMSQGTGYLGTLLLNNGLTVSGNTTTRGTVAMASGALTLQGATNDLGGGALSTGANTLAVPNAGTLTLGPGTKTVSAGGNISVTSANVVINGTLSHLGTTLTIGGNVSGSGTLSGIGNTNLNGVLLDFSGITTTFTGGTVTLGGATATKTLTIDTANDSFNNLTINNANGVNVAGTRLVVNGSTAANLVVQTGNLVLTNQGALVRNDLAVAGGTLTGSGGSINVGRNVNLTGAASVDFTSTHTLLNLDGTAAQAITQAGHPLGSVTVNNTGAATPVVIWNDAINSGTLVLQDGATSLAAGGTIAAVGAATANLVATQPLTLAGTLGVDGNVTFSGAGTFATSGSSTLLFNGTTPQSLSSVGQTFDALEISSSNTVTLVDATDTANLTLSAGTLNTGNQPIVASGTTTFAAGNLQVAGSTVDLNGPISSTGGTVAQTGGTIQCSNTTVNFGSVTYNGVASGTFLLDGGVQNLTPPLTAGTGINQFTAGGGGTKTLVSGTLKADLATVNTGVNLELGNSTLTVQTGDLLINGTLSSAGTPSINVAGALTVPGTGSLNLTGAGSLDLAGNLTTTPGPGFVNLSNMTVQTGGSTVTLSGVDTWTGGQLQVDRNGSVSVVPAPISLPAFRVLTGGGGGGIVTFTAGTTITGATNIDGGVLDLNRAHTFNGPFNLGDLGSVTGSTKSQTVTFNGGVTVGAGTGGSLNLDTSGTSGSGTGLDLVFAEGTTVIVNNGASFIVEGRTSGGDQTILRDQDAIGASDAGRWTLTRVGTNTVTIDACRVQDSTATVAVTAVNSTDQGGNNIPWDFAPKTTRWSLATGNGTWSNPSNWSNGIPGNGDTVEFTNVGTGISTNDLPAGVMLGVLNMNAGGNAYPGTLTNNNAMMVSGNSTIRGTFNLGANVLFLGGNNDLGGTMNTIISQLNATGASATTTVTGTVNVATLGGQFNVTNDLVINGTVTPTGTGLVDVGGNLAGSGNLNGTGNVNVEGATVNTSGLTLAMTGGTFILDRGVAGPVTFTNGAGNHFFDLSIATTGTTTLAAPLVVDNSLSLSGVLALNAQGVMITQDLLVDGGTLSGVGTILVEAGSTTLSSSATLQPGGATGIGTLTFDFFEGGTALNDTAIEIDLQSDSTHDFIKFGNSAIRAAGTANLQLNVIGPVSGFTGTPIIIMTGIDGSIAGGGITFNNIAYGERLLTADGKLSFIVSGSPTSETVILDLPVPTNAGHVETLLTGPGGPFEGETDPAIIGFNADPDGDGIVNVFELWFGTDPDSPNASPVYSISPITIGLDVFAALDVTVVSAVDDVLLIEGLTNEDLGTFEIGTRSVVSEADGQRNLRFLSSSVITAEQAFGRLEVDPNAIRP